MNICHHPNDETLLDYTSGALGEAWSLAIATHLAICPDCRKSVERMEAVAGSLFDVSPAASVSEGLLETIMTRMDDAPEYAAPRVAPERDNSACLPQPLRGYAGGDADALEWCRLGPAAHQVVLLAEEDDTVARLLRIPAGKPVPEHTHGGNEMTLVLRGAFEDHTGRYGRGDFQEADETVMHRPFAAPGEDCICLAVTDAPLRFKSMAARLLQPVIGI